MGRVLDAAQVSEELVDVGRCPLPGVFVWGFLEPCHQPFPRLDGAERQVSAQLLVAPPGEHLILGMQEPYIAELQHPVRRINRHKNPPDIALDA